MYRENCAKTFEHKRVELIKVRKGISFQKKKKTSERNKKKKRLEIYMDQKVGPISGFLS